MPPGRFSLLARSRQLLREKDAGPVGHKNQWKKSNKSVWKPAERLELNLNAELRRPGGLKAEPAGLCTLSPVLQRRAGCQNEFDTNRPEESKQKSKLLPFGPGATTGPNQALRSCDL